MTVAAEHAPGRADWGRLFDDVRASVSCIDLYQRHGTTNVPQGRTQATVRCIAPDHPDTDPSMSLGETGFKCHSCGTHGDVVSMWALVHGLDPNGREDRKTSALELADLGRLRLDEYQTDHHRPRGRGGRPKPVPKQQQNTDDQRAGGFRARRELFARIWQIVEPMGLTDAARRWLDSRGLGTGAASAHGVRDWSPMAPAIVEILRDSDRATLTAAGFIKSNGEPWRPLQAMLNDEPWARGAMVPVWHPDHPEAPVGVRLRLYKPFEKNGRLVKALAQPSSGLGVSRLPIGLIQPPARVQRLLYEWPHRGGDDDRKRWRDDDRWHRPDDTTGPYSVVLCEGETDWLSVADALVDHPTPHRVAPVGICQMSSGWPDQITPLIASAERVVCLFDVGPDKGEEKRRTGEKVADEVGTGLIKRVGVRHAQRIYRRCLLDDDHDANDLHRAGDLRPLLDTLLGEA